MSYRKVELRSVAGETRGMHVQQPSCNLQCFSAAIVAMQVVTIQGSCKESCKKMVLRNMSLKDVLSVRPRI